LVCFYYFNCAKQFISALAHIEISSKSLARARDFFM